MKPLLIFLSSIIPLTVQARIGEDYSKCLDRYGDVYIKYDGNHGSEYALFGKSIFKINITLWNGNVHQIGYGKNTAFTDSEFTYMLKVNGGEHAWQRVDEARWMTRNAELTAVRRNSGEVIIFTTAYGDHYSLHKSRP